MNILDELTKLCDETSEGPLKAVYIEFETVHEAQEWLAELIPTTSVKLPVKIHFVRRQRADQHTDGTITTVTGNGPASHNNSKFAVASKLAIPKFIDLTRAAKNYIDDPTAAGAYGALFNALAEFYDE